jgi:hypothetical protein
MKTVLVRFLVASLALATGCIKSTTDSAVKPDGSATVTLSVRYALDAIEKMNKVPDSCTCWYVYQIHKDSVPAARKALAAFESGFDGKKVSDAWTQLGLRVTKSAVSDRDGWRILEIEASTANVADVNAKLASAMKTAGADEYLTKIPRYLHSRKLLPKLPRFYKTSDPAVVKAVIPVADFGQGVENLSPLREEERNKLEKQLTYMRNMRSFDDGEITVRVKLPGTIVSVDNAKQEGTDTVVLDLAGPRMDPDVISGQAKAKGLITVMLKIDPGTFKIPLEEG